MILTQKKKFGHLPFLGIYSRGKSHILRLAVPIQLLLTEFDTDNDAVCIPPCMLTLIVSIISTLE